MTYIISNKQTEIFYFLKSQLNFSWSTPEYNYSEFTELKKQKQTKIEQRNEEHGARNEIMNSVIDLARIL